MMIRRIDDDYEIKKEVPKIFFTTEARKAQRFLSFFVCREMPANENN
jgi:hypothetical protein